MVAFDWNGTFTPDRLNTTMYYNIHETITFSLDRENEPYYVIANASISQPSYSRYPIDLNWQGLSLGGLIPSPYDEEVIWAGLSATLQDAEGSTFRMLDSKANTTGQNNNASAHSLECGWFGHWAFVPSADATLTLDLRCSIRQYNFYYQDLDPGTLTGCVTIMPEATLVGQESLGGAL